MKPESEPVIQLQDVWKVYGEDGHKVETLRGANLSIPPGGLVAIVGPSGSGKSTLLNLLGGMDRPTRGRVVVAGLEPAALSDAELTRFRREHVGFVFQDFHLIPTLTALENVMLPMEYAGIERKEREERARRLLDQVGLAHRLDHLPGKLSGGEKQRVGIARAFANDPDIILADEPTGSLDRATGEAVIQLLDEFRRRAGRTVIVVTHDEALAERAEQVWRLRDGTVLHA